MRTSGIEGAIGAPADERGEWLAAFRQRFESAPDADRALALARAEWLCGEYASALVHFLTARQLGGERIDVHVALIRAAMMLGDRRLAAEATDIACAIHPASPALAIHRAQLLLPDEPAAARSAVTPHRDADPICALFCDALETFVGAVTPSAGYSTEPRLAAMWSGFCWLRAHAPSRGILDLPIDILHLALEQARIEGVIVECGVYYGRSLRLIAQRAGQHVHGFDSFRGFPEPWNAKEPAGHLGIAGRLPEMPANVSLHAGWFEDTLPSFFAAQSQPVRLLHIDCDLYRSTRTVLESARAHLCPGSMLLFDDFLGYPGYEQHEFRAFHEFAEANRMRWSVIGGVLMAREVCIRIDSIDVNDG